MNLSPSVEQTLHQGLMLAASNKHEFLTLEHLLWGSLQIPEMQEMMRVMKVDIKSLEGVLKKHILETSPLSVAAQNPDITTTVQRVLSRSAQMASAQNVDQLTLWMVLLNMLNEVDSHAAYFLNQFKVNALAVKSYASHGAAAFDQSGVPQTTEGVDQATDTRSPLAKFAVNLNARAEDNKIDNLIGRAYEIDRTAQVLARRRKNNPLLVGEPGVGKTAIAEGLAKLIVEGDVPDALKGKTIWSLNVGAMLAGTKYRGDFEQRIKDVLDEVAKDNNIVLFIDEIHTLIGAGSSGGNSMDASNIIKPALASGDLRVIGATTFQEYREIFEKEKALDRRFQKVDVVEPTPQETVDILKGLKKSLEEHHGTKYTMDAIEAAVNLSVKYIPDRFLPDKAIDVLDEAGAAEQLRPARQRHRFIDKVLIEETVAKITRIPVAQVTENEKGNLKNLDLDLKGAVFGQDEAIDKLTTAVCVAKAGLNDENKPLGSFMFAGPTGVGKTEVARQLSKSLGIPLVRFDMSEYMESHSVARLIGAPPGYVGYDKGGLLSDAVFKNPHSIILLDEIEKAHPDVHNLLLQVLDDGSLTDTNGRKVNFKNTIIIMTTNAGATAAQKASMGFVKVDHSSEGRKVLDSTFAPEFRNRIDSIVTFHALGTDEINKIVDKKIRELEVNLKAKSVTLDVSDEARAVLAKEGFVPLMGARPMARLVQEKLKAPLAQKILFGDLTAGGHAFVTVDTTGNWLWTTTPSEEPKVASDAAPAPKKRSRKSVPQSA